MRSILPIALIMGALSGLLAGAFLNIFNVPVMEWAISLEEAAAGDAAAEEGGIAVSLGMQRIGMVFGLALAGVLVGAVFTGLYHLVRQATPGWNTWAWATIAGLLGFWSVSLFTQLRFPLNPPGVGEESSLLARQGFQFLFMIISLAAVAGVCLAMKAVNQSTAGATRWAGYAGVALVYAVASVIFFSVIPGSPDATPEWVPQSLVIMFRSFTVIGHFILWMALAWGVAGYLKYKESGVSMQEAQTPSGALVN